MAVTAAGQAPAIAATQGTDPTCYTSAIPWIQLAKK